MAVFSNTHTAIQGAIQKSNTVAIQGAIQMYHIQQYTRFRQILNKIIKKSDTKILSNQPK
jgi:hypothetical protein